MACFAVTYRRCRWTFWIQTISHARAALPMIPRMNIIGPDELVFGVDDVAACTQYFTDYGLQPVGGGRFEALDGTAVVIRRAESRPSLIETVYGVGDAATLDAIVAELRKDRDVRRADDGSVSCVDDM